MAFCEKPPKRVDSSIGQMDRSILFIYANRFKGIETGFLREAVFVLMRCTSLRCTRANPRWRRY